MKRATTFAQSEKGQTLLIVAVVMVGLIAFMGLAIDGGNMFVQRREAQNAADAAALAGARVLAKAIHTCGGSASALDDEIAQKINEYAEVNGISDTDGNPGNGVNDNIAGHYVTGAGTVLGTVGGGAVPEGTIGVQVQVQDEHETFFITIVGIGTATSSAKATAVVGAITALPPGIGVLPLAVHWSVLNGIGYDDPFEVANLGDTTTPFCEDDDGDGKFDDCVPVPDDNSSQRGWLNLNGVYNLEGIGLPGQAIMNRTFGWSAGTGTANCDKNPDEPWTWNLAAWATRDACPYPFPLYAGDRDGDIRGDWIHGSPGLVQAALSAIDETYVGHIGIVPLFDRIVDGPDMPEKGFTPARVPDPPGGNRNDWPNDPMYHVVGFVGMYVQDVQGKGLTGTFRESIFGTGRISTEIHGYDPDGCDNRMLAVVLWE